jgi:hypothetical protein
MGLGKVFLYLFNKNNGYEKAIIDHIAGCFRIRDSFSPT